MFLLHHKTYFTRLFLSPFPVLNTFFPLFSLYQFLKASSVLMATKPCEYRCVWTI